MPYKKLSIINLLDIYTKSQIETINKAEPTIMAQE